MTVTAFKRLRLMGRLPRLAFKDLGPMPGWFRWPMLVTILVFGQSTLGDAYRYADLHYAHEVHEARIHAQAARHACVVLEGIYDEAGRQRRVKLPPGVRVKETPRMREISELHGRSDCTVR